VERGPVGGRVLDPHGLILQNAQRARAHTVFLEQGEDVRHVVGVLSGHGGLGVARLRARDRRRPRRFEGLDGRGVRRGPVSRFEALARVRAADFKVEGRVARRSRAPFARGVRRRDADGRLRPPDVGEVGLEADDEATVRPPCDPPEGHDDGIVGRVFEYAHLVETVFANLPVFGTSSQWFLGGGDGFTVLLSLVPIALLLAVARERLTTSPVEGIVSGIGVLVDPLWPSRSPTSRSRPSSGGR
jgi:hypothetical protein